MKELFKKISVLLVIVMVSCTWYKPSLVHAEEEAESNILTINLPSNEVRMTDHYANIYYYEYMVINMLWSLYSDDTGTIINDDGKKIITYHEADGYIYYELYEGATEEDCIIDLPEEIQAGFAEEGLNYKKVRFVLKEFETYEPTTDQVIIDLSSINNLLYSKTIDLYLLSIITFGPDYFITEEYSIYTDLNNKILLLENNDKEFSLGSDVSSSDDIVYKLTPEDIERLLEDDIDVSEYDKIVLKFGDKSYDESHYVVEGSSEYLNNHRGLFSDLWNFFIEKGLVKGETDILIYYDSEGNELFKIPDFSEGDYKADSLNNLKYDDNYRIDISEDEDIKEILSNDFSYTNPENIIIKFGDPKVIEGEGQKVDASKDDAVFRLNIPFEKFSETGLVYVDDELVDPSNYEATEGSTVIKFKKDYLSSIGNGNHTLKVSVVDGDATTTFTVGGSSPETGDNLLLYLSLLLMSISGLFVVRKLKNN